MEERTFSDISFEKYLDEDRLMGSQCKKCNEVFLPPRPICIKCHSPEMKWVEMETKGRLSAFTCIAIGPPSMIEEGYNRKNPYCSGVVELDKGVKVDARIVGVDAKNPEKITIGMPLKAKFIHRDNGEGTRTHLAFEPRS